eukprot:13655841-Alexandrium_andersonii.AAC.1
MRCSFWPSASRRILRRQPASPIGAGSAWARTRSDRGRRCRGAVCGRIWTAMRCRPASKSSDNRRLCPGRCSALRC